MKRTSKDLNAFLPPTTFAARRWVLRSMLGSSFLADHPRPESLLMWIMAWYEELPPLQGRQAGHVAKACLLSSSLRPKVIPVYHCSMSPTWCRLCFAAVMSSCHRCCKNHVVFSPRWTHTDYIHINVLVPLQHSNSPRRRGRRDSPASLVRQRCQRCCEISRRRWGCVACLLGSLTLRRREQVGVNQHQRGRWRRWQQYEGAMLV